MNTKELLDAPKPLKGESLLGYILRLTEENFYESSAYIYRLMGEERGRIVQKIDDIMIQKLSEITKVDSNELKKMSFTHNNEDGIPLKYLNLKKAKICPMCLDEYGYIKKVWDFVFLTACPIHEIMLIDTCPNCKKEIYLGRNNLDKCKCKYEFNNSSSHPVNKEELLLSKAILKDYQNEDIRFEFPINNLSIIDIFDLIFLIFRIKNWGLGKKHVMIKELSVVEMNKQSTQAFNVYKNWPENFYNFLEEQSNRLDELNIDKKGIYGEFGELYRILRDEYSNKPFLLEAFEAYLTDNREKYLTSTSLIHKLTEKAGIREQYMHGTEAIAYLGLKLPTIQYLIEENILKGTLNKSNKFVYALVDMESAKALKEIMTTWYSFQKTMEALKISEGVLLDLIDKSYLDVFVVPINKGRYKKRYIDPESINKLLEKIESKIINKYTSNPKLLNFSEAFLVVRNMLLRKDFTFLAFLDDILNNKIIPCAKCKESGFNAFLFNKDEIKNYYIVEIEKLNKDSLSRKDAIKALNITEANFEQFVKLGFLNVEMRRGSNSGIRVPHKEIKRFKNTYIDLKEIRDSYEFDFHPSVNLLIKRGIMPITGSKIDGNKKYLFLKKDIENIAKRK